MRVLMTSDSVGGVWTYAMELTRAMPGENFIVATVGDHPRPSQLREVPSNVRLVTADAGPDQADGPSADAGRTAEWLLEIERRESPDLIHLNGYAHGALPFRAPTLVVGHSCALSWSKAIDLDFRPQMWEHYRAAVTSGLRGASFVVASSMAMLDALHNHYDFSTPARVIHNGAHTRGPVTRRMNTERAIVLAIGDRTDAARNIRAVIDAAPLIHAPVTVAERLDDDAVWDALDGTSIYLSPS